MKYVLETFDIMKRYKHSIVLEKLNMHVPNGSIYGLIGRNGAGKTTIFRILTTLLVTDEGKATVADLDVVNDYKTIRNSVGYMPGKFSLYQDLTVEENLTFFATIFGTTIEENYELIEDIYVQIEPFKNRRAGALSGGMKQKLALCCALIHAPKVLFLDEPTTGVDPVSRKEFWQMLKRLQKKGITILVSTPYMDEASLCDRIALIQNGKVLKIDSPQAITSDYDKVIYDIQSKNTHGLIHDLKNYPSHYSVYAFGEFIHYIDKNPDFNPQNIVNYLENKNHTDIIIKTAITTIEDVFMDL